MKVDSEDVFVLVLLFLSDLLVVVVYIFTVLVRMMLIWVNSADGFDCI